MDARGPDAEIGAGWDDGTLVIRARTGDGTLPAVLAVVPVGALHLGSGLVATAGTWERSDTVARFTPRFAPVAATVFAVVGRADARDEWVELARVSAPGDRAVPRAVVETIDPGGEEVPANLLRFAVTFSAPMGEGSAAGRLHLHDESGTELPGALLAMPPELWDRDRRRLTVLLEPGRIKRGLQPNVQAGPPLREGETVTLVVDAGIRDAAGAPLVAGASRRYRVGPALRSRVDPAAWAVRWPDVGEDASGSPLLVRFDRPLDRALVRRYVRLLDGRGHPVPGHFLLNADVTEWMFAPASVDAADRAAWRLHVDARLEDLAGNSVRRVFDRDLSDPADDSIDATVIILWPER
ncbi:Ig-like domain-containing protein [Herbiconiux sp. P16]|uniref:Ig-like domain-containing protein n=1 Tax=Herbiconiux wuyangfengii TaxID=3342794 RepID=UPI0035B81D92